MIKVISWFSENMMVPLLLIICAGVWTTVMETPKNTDRIDGHDEILKQLSSAIDILTEKDVQKRVKNAKFEEEHKSIRGDIADIEQDIRDAHK